MPQYDRYCRSFEDPEAGELQVHLDILSTVLAHVCHNHSKNQFESWQTCRINLLMKKKIEVRRKLQEMGAYDSEQEDEVAREAAILDRSKRKKPKDKQQRFGNTFIKNFEIDWIIRKGGLAENLDIFFGTARTTRIIESYDKTTMNVSLRPGAAVWGPCIFHEKCTSIFERSVPSATAKTYFSDEVRRAKLHIAVLEAVLDHFNEHHRKKAGEKAVKSQIKLAKQIEVRRDELRKSEAKQLQNPGASQKSTYNLLKTIDDDYDDLEQFQ
ncbi:uncharacterized protein FOMMEDRAFT_161890 [Fomitiporia mediterranea MF3/22]|uniref:uncharacterized protein n=1 Tax=Fomitiporia mediterranea (strain MF3/22) TaxID=694068 RepID=UPI000440916E|nr:uncharacterized protein FOMMEDRAFT_161890 [Fomitiporia mediterranea MF3/22]EJC98515.1 hypothetical protein FOMMEDRAFT_161890 [Fomitiporia mediterranea MF3/22]